MNESKRLTYVKPAVEIITLDTDDIIQTSGLETNLLDNALFKTEDAIWRSDWVK